MYEYRRRWRESESEKRKKQVRPKVREINTEKVEERQENEWGKGSDKKKELQAFHLPTQLLYLLNSII